MKVVANRVVFLMAISGVQGVLFPGSTVRVAIQLMIFATIAVMLFNARTTLWQSQLDFSWSLKSFGLYSVFVFLHGTFVAASYEQWRYLVATYMPFLLLPLIALLSTSPEGFMSMVRSMVAYCVPMSFLFFLGGASDKHGNLVYLVYVSFVYVLILLVPYVGALMKGGIISLALVSFFYDTTNRTNILSISISVALLLIYYFAGNLGYGITVRGRSIFLLSASVMLYVPIVLLILGIFLDINIFDVLSYLAQTQLGNVSTEQELNTSDSRTVIYKDAYASLADSGNWLIGISPASYYFTLLSSTLEDYDLGRLGSPESGFLGFATFGGIIFPTLLFLVFWFAVHAAILRSNSMLLKVLGLYLAARWFVLFIENPIGLNMYWVTTFMLIGAALSPHVRSLSDQDLRTLISHNLSYLKRAKS